MGRRQAIARAGLGAGWHVAGLLRCSAEIILYRNLRGDSDASWEHLQ